MEVQPLDQQDYAELKTLGLRCSDGLSRAYPAKDLR